MKKYSNEFDYHFFRRGTGNRGGFAQGGVKLDRA
jgi:hypothetical protein